MGPGVDGSCHQVALCPITQEPYEDPVMCADGHTYSREAITGWFAYGRCTSPMTGLRLDSLVLVPNHAMRITVEQMVDERIRLEWRRRAGSSGRSRGERAGSPDVLKSRARALAPVPTTLSVTENVLFVRAYYHPASVVLESPSTSRRCPLAALAAAARVGGSAGVRAGLRPRHAAAVFSSGRRRAADARRRGGGAPPAPSSARRLGRRRLGHARRRRLLLRRVHELVEERDDAARGLGDELVGVVVQQLHLRHGAGGEGAV